MSLLHEVQIGALPMDRLRAVIGEERLWAWHVTAAAARDAFAGRTVWNVNSTAVGGGVAEMLQVVLAYARGAAIDTRWLVIDGDAEFFAVTKRLHNRLHGVPGDGGPLGVAERVVLERRWAANAARLVGLVRSGDVVVLHDPQTAGLVAALRARGATVVWRCHIGADTVSDHVEEAWGFLRGWLEPADAFVFSRRPHVHPWMPGSKVAIIPPSIDPLSPKNQPLDRSVVRAILGRVGFLDDVADGTPMFQRRDGSPGAVSRTAVFPRRGAAPAGDIPMVVQVSRWDRLKDMAGVLRAFAEHVPAPAHLALVGPAVDGVADDPEASAVLGECMVAYDRLPRSVRARVHLVSLPVDDPDENAAVVNALQRHASVVVQKSLQEGFGLTVTEAMIKARPVVATRVGGIQDQIRHGRDGLLVDDPTDLGGCAAAVNRLLADPPLAERLGVAAQARAIEEFVGDRHLTRYADLLLGLVAGCTLVPGADVVPGSVGYRSGPWALVGGPRRRQREDTEVNVMPDGLLQWYDARRGEGRVVRGGREYPVEAADVEPCARVPGARVHFDVKRHEGVNVAVNVRLRPGTRVSRRQRRFGDMAGARRPDTRGTAPFARPHPEMGHHLASQPRSVAERWAALVAEGDIENAMLLYAPDAAVHTGDGNVRGRRLHGWLSSSGLSGHIQAVETAGAGDQVIVRWRGPDGRAATSWVHIEHGQIAEQWMAGRRPAGRHAPSPPIRADVTVVARDPQSEAARDNAERKVRRVMEAIGEPILHARVKLSMASDPAVERPARAEAVLDVNGQLVRAHVSGHTLQEAVDLLEPRLRGRALHAAARVRTLHLRPPETPPGEWHHGQAPTDRPEWLDRPPEEREVVRHKTFALDELTVDEAADDMGMLDFDFYLFHELATGVDAVLHRRPDGRLGLRRLHPVDPAPSTEAVDVVLEPGTVPALALDEAVEWLDVAGEPFVFFRNLETGRANVAYRRYDGHYGLTVPADEPPPPAEPSIVRRRLRDELARLAAVRAALEGEGLAEENEANSVAETSTIDQHQADLGTETFERTRDQSLLEDVQQEIADVQRAFVRLDRGTYGRCDACGSQIPDDRLTAVPAARFCLEHQAAAEVIPGVVT